MFRKHAALLNTVPNLELMVCDEGHRLKNIGGTKTMDALRSELLLLLLLFALSHTLRIFARLKQCL